MGDAHRDSVEEIALSESQARTHDDTAAHDHMVSNGERRGSHLLGGSHRFGKLEDGTGQSAHAANGGYTTFACTHRKPLLVVLGCVAFALALLSAAPVVVLSVVTMMAALSVRIACPPASSPTTAACIHGAAAFAVLPLLALVHLLRFASILSGTRPTVGWLLVLALTLGRSILYSGAALRLASARAAAALLPAAAQMQMLWSAMRDVLCADLYYTWTALLVIALLEPRYGGTLLASGLWGLLAHADPTATDPTGYNMPLLLQLCGMLCAHALARDARSHLPLASGDTGDAGLNGDAGDAGLSAAVEVRAHDAPLGFDGFAPDVRCSSGGCPSSGSGRLSCLACCELFVTSVATVGGMLMLGVAGGFWATWHQVRRP